MLDFVALLREAGMRIEIERVDVYLEALSVVEAYDLGALHLAGRLTLCSRLSDLALYDACFASHFLGDAHEEGLEPEIDLPPMLPGSAATLQRFGSHDERELHVGATSPEERLRHSNLAKLSDEEKAQVHALIASMRGRVELRPCRRRQPWRTGVLDMRLTVQSAFRHAGDPDGLHRRRPRLKSRRRVFLLDVSGSMSPYAGGLLRLAFAAHHCAPGFTEVFTIGTRLTRITPHLRVGDAESAIVGASRAIPDWSGGTRLGDQIKAFLDLWGHRGMARGAILVLASDGWERGDTTMLTTQMERLSRLTRRIIWVNPHASVKGFEPLARGMQAALPFIDELVAGSTANEMEAVLRSLAQPNARTSSAV